MCVCMCAPPLPAFHPAVGKYLRNAVLPAIANFVTLMSANALTPYSQWEAELARMVIGLTQLFEKSPNTADVQVCVCVCVMG